MKVFVMLAIVLGITLEMSPMSHGTPRRVTEYLKGSGCGGSSPMGRSVWVEGSHPCAKDLGGCRTISYLKSTREFRRLSHSRRLNIFLMAWARIQDLEARLTFEEMAELSGYVEQF